MAENFDVLKLCKKGRKEFNGSFYSCFAVAKILILTTQLTTTTAAATTTQGCCPNGGVWSNWALSTPCATTCGACSQATYNRTCLSQANGCPCSGSSNMTEYCNVQPCTGSTPATPCCPVWSAWSSYSACNDTCGSCGVTTRTRTCTTASTCPCTGPSTETTACNLTPCANPRQSCCNGLSAQSSGESIICGPQPVAPTYPPATCTAPCCPTWSDWGPWGSCNDTCGSCGVQTRSRICTSTCACTGDSTQTQNCNLTPCAYPRLSCCNSMKAIVSNRQIICGPQPPAPTPEPTAAPCSTVAPVATPASPCCNSLTPQTLSSGAVVCGPLPTLPPSTMDCSCCPSGGVWNEWSSWSTCSGTACNTCGTITRSRTCASDACQCPCEGLTFEEQPCTVTGVWSAWSSPSACNDTCGACGVSTQTRTCTTPNCPCTGASTLTTSCGLAPCVFPRDSCCSPYSADVYNGNIQCGPIPASPTDAPSAFCTCCSVGGTWSEWASTGTCSDVCGSCGTIQQTRTCTSASSNCPCTGPTTRTINCNSVPCQYPKNSCCNSMTPMSINGAIICGPQPSYADLTPVTSGCLPTGCCPSEGVWSTWSSPSACNDTCGSCGVITRTRTCMTTANGCPCTGDSTMYTPCGTQPCTYPRMSCCGTYKAMAVSGRHICGPLPAITTDAPPGPLTCAASACAPGGTWSAWSASACNDTCGMCGSMIQTRTCTSAPACPCTGSTQQIGAACANLVCKFPRGTCCAGYTRATGQFVCQPSTGRKKRAIGSEDDNVTYETDELEQQPSTSSHFSDTLNNILAYVGDLLTITK